MQYKYCIPSNSAGHGVTFRKSVNKIVVSVTDRDKHAMMEEGRRIVESFVIVTHSCELEL